MSSFKRDLLAYCTASLVTGIIGASNGEDAGLSHTREMEGRFPILPRRILHYRNETRSPETAEPTSFIPTTSTFIASTTAESVATPILEMSDSPSPVSTPVSSSYYALMSSLPETPWASGTSLGGSSDAGPTSTMTDRTGIMMQGPTQEQQPYTTISVTLSISAHGALSEQVISSFFDPALSSRASSTNEQIYSSSQVEIASSSATPTPSSTHAESSQASSTQKMLFTSEVVVPTSEASTISTSILPSPQDQLNKTSSASQIHVISSASVFVPTSEHFEPSQALNTQLLSATSADTADLLSSSVSTLDSSSTVEPSTTLVDSRSTAISTASPVAIESHTIQTDNISQPAPSATSAGVSDSPVLANSTINSESIATAFSTLAITSLFPNGSDFTGSGSSNIFLVSETPTISTQPSVISVTSSGITYPVASDTDALISPGGSSTLGATGNNATILSATSTVAGVDTSSSSMINPTTKPDASISSSLGFGSLYSSTQANVNQTATQTASGSGINVTITSSNLSSRLSDKFAAQPTTYTDCNATASDTAPLPSTTPEVLFGATINSTPSITEFGIRFTGTASATGAIGHSETPSDSVQTVSATYEDNSTATQSGFATLVSTSDSDTPTNIYSFTPSSGTDTLSDDAYADAARTSSTTYSPANSATETATAAPLLPLNPSQTAGVALGSTAGVLLAIVAVIFVARRAHVARAAKRRGSGNSIYPKVAYLYDPSFGNSGSKDNRDDKGSAFMSGGAGGLPPGGSSPRAPRGSLAYDHRYSTRNVRYSDPGNPFRDSEDAFMDWRSSEAIAAPIDAALAAAAGYESPSKPVPTPSALIENRSSANSSKAQRKASPVFAEYSSLSPYERTRNQSLSSILEAGVNESFPEALEHDLFLPVDVRTETPDSVMVYATSPLLRTPMRPTMPTIPSDGSSSRLRSTGSILFPSLLEPQCERSWSSLAYDNRISAAYPDIGPDGQAITLRTDYASPISPCVMPLNKGWEDIKRFSIGSSSTVSPISKSPPYVFSPPSLDVSPPQPLKKRSLVQIRRKTLLADTGQAMTQTPYSPLSVRTFFTHNSNASFEGLRMSLLAKMNSIGDARDNHAMSPSSKTANSLWYRDSITRNAQQHWGPDDVGRRF